MGAIGRKCARVLWAIATAILLVSPAWAHISASRLAKQQIEGFHIGMSATEAESVLRNLPGIEEAHFDYSPAYDCNQLLDDEESASDIPIPQVTLRFDIDKADQHVAEIYFDQTPAGPILSSIWYYNFLKDRSWAANLRYASKRFGKPDILRSDQEGRHRAFWCQAGEPNCGSDGAYTRRIELMWNPPHGVSGASAGSVTLVADESDEADESRTARYVAVARKDPAAGKRLYNTCRLANGLVFDQADADRRQANLIGDLDTWSPAISEPRRVSIPVLRAAGIDPDALVRDHNCANGVGRTLIAM